MKYAIVLGLILIAGPALADPRKIDFSTIIVDQDSVPFEECADVTDKDCKTKKPLTLGAASLRALALPERDMEQAESWKRGELAMRVYKSTAAQLTAEEISLIKKQIAKAYNPLVTYRAVSILDPQPEK